MASRLLAEGMAHPWLGRLGAWRRRLRIVGYLAPVAAFTYCGWLIVSGIDQLGALRVFASILPLVLFEYLAALLLQLALWLDLVRVHASTSWTDVSIFSRAVTLRTLPGGAWHWAGRAAMYSGETVNPPGMVLKGTVVETLLMCSTGIGLVAWARPETPLLVRGILLVMALVTAVLASLWWRPGPVSLLRWLGRLLLWLGLSLGAWVAGGAITHELVKVGGAGDLPWLTAIYIWAAVGLVGIGVSLLPSSLGVRELLLVWFLAPYMTPVLSVVVGITLRFVFLVADALWGGCGWAVSHLFLRAPASRSCP